MMKIPLNLVMTQGLKVNTVNIARFASCRQIPCLPCEKGTQKKHLLNQ